MCVSKPISEYISHSLCMWSTHINLFIADKQYAHWEGQFGCSLKTKPTSREPGVKQWTVPAGCIQTRVTGLRQKKNISGDSFSSMLHFSSLPFAIMWFIICNLRQDIPGSFYPGNIHVSSITRRIQVMTVSFPLDQGRVEERLMLANDSYREHVITWSYRLSVSLNVCATCYPFLQGWALPV